jgi:hypothetical protein
MYKAGSSLRHDRSPAPPKITMSGASAAAAELMAGILTKGCVTQEKCFQINPKDPPLSIWRLRRRFIQII